VAEQRDRDPGAEIQVSSPAAVEQVSTFAALELDRSALVNRQERRHRGVRHGCFLGPEETLSLPEIARPCQRLLPSPGLPRQRRLTPAHRLAMLDRGETARQSFEPP